MLNSTLLWHICSPLLSNKVKTFSIQKIQSVLSLVSRRTTIAYLHSETARAIQLPSNRQTNVHRQKHDFLGEHQTFEHFFPRCMECQRGLAMRKVSVCLSVRPSLCESNACIVTKRKKHLSRFFYIKTKDHLTSSSEKKKGWWGRPLLPQILGQPARWSEIADIEPILVAPQP